jgi:sialic acid synthase SpsE
VKIIAEIGINWNGEMKLIEELIRQAKIGGASTAKFQLYDSVRLFGDDSRKKYELSYQQAKQAKQLCDVYEIDFLASVFDDERLGWCEKMNVNSYKIASRTLKHDPELCQRIVRLGKPVLASLGMWKMGVHLPFLENNVRYLHCISKYPTSACDLEKPILDERVIGVSDHSYGIGFALYAIAHGARVVEKHFTLEKSAQGNDHVGSMDLRELKHLREYGDLLAITHKRCSLGLS